LVVYLYGSGHPPFPGPQWLDVLVTVLWVVGVTNASTFSTTWTAVGRCSDAGRAVLLRHRRVNGQFLVAALSAAVAGCCVGLPAAQLPPAKIYMGDAGQPLPRLPAGLPRRSGSSWSTRPPAVALFVPVLVLGVPLLDTTLVTVTRCATAAARCRADVTTPATRLVWVGFPVPWPVGPSTRWPPRSASSVCCCPGST
jgi:UDP-GlcNAc:undecaprenyl-phosphate GlcNAc-1-phosphate transferase